MQGLTAALALLAGVACATPGWGRGGWVREDGGWRHARLGYAIAAPGPAGYWSEGRVDGAGLALRGAGGEWMSVSVRCAVPLAAPRVLARHLEIGLGAPVLEGEGEVMVAGRRAWARRFETGAGAERVRVKTVTRVDERCVQDFALAARGEWPAAEAAFDAWWASFRAAPDAAGAAR